MKILTAEQMRDTDRLTTERYGVPSLTLMENAGAAIADYLSSFYADLAQRKIVVLCGKGNNGGDGLVVARHLYERNLRPQVILCAYPSAMRGDAAVNLQRWQQLVGGVRSVASDAEWQDARAALGEASLIVDALLGTGLTGQVEGLLAAVIEDVNRARQANLSLAVVSVDMPSGLPSGTEDYGGPIVAADVTVTLTAPKVGQLLSPRAESVGKLVVRQIGTPRALLDDNPDLKLHWIEPGEFRELRMVRPRDSNKGTFGHALLLAGSWGKSGAAVLAGRAALRVGAGLVTVATPADVIPIVANGMPELMTAPLIPTEAGTVGMANRDFGRWEQIAKGKSVLALGPGLSTNHETQQFVQALLAETPLPVILDADGLNAFDGKTQLLTSRKTSLLAMTPHPGEMARLVGTSAAEVQKSRLQMALDHASRWRAYVVLKGFHTILATPDGHAFINSTGNPGMAKGGTGDVLTGMLAGLTAEFGTPHWERVLALGVYLHGLAGDLAAERIGETSMVASDLIDALPAAFTQFIAEWHRARN